MARITAAHIQWLKHRIADIAYWYKKEGKRTHAKDIERLEEIAAFYTSTDEKDFPLIFIALKNEIDSFWKAFIDRKTEAQAEKILADHPNDHSFGREMGVLFKELQSLSDTKDSTLKGITAPIHFDAFKITPDNYTSLKNQIASLKLQREYAEHLNKKIAELDLGISLKIKNQEQAFLDLYQDLKKTIKKPEGTFTSREYDTFRRTITGLLGKIEESTPPFAHYLLEELKQEDSPIKQKILKYHEDKKDVNKEKSALTNHIGRLFDSSKIGSYYPQRYNALYEKFRIVFQLLPSNPTLDPSDFSNEIKSAFNDLFDNIFADVCTQLLDSKGQLKPLLYNELGFTNSTTHDFKKDDIKDITKQIIKSYFNDPLVGAFLNRLQRGNTIKAEHMPGKISLFSKLLNNKFETYEEHLNKALISPETATAKEKRLQYYARTLNESEDKSNKTLSSLIDTVLSIKKNLIKAANTLTDSSKIEGELLDSIEQSTHIPNSAERFLLILNNLFNKIDSQKSDDASSYIQTLNTILPGYQSKIATPTNVPADTPRPTTTKPTDVELSRREDTKPTLAAATTAATATTASAASPGSATSDAKQPRFFQSTAPTSSDTEISLRLEQDILAIHVFFGEPPANILEEDKKALNVSQSFEKYLGTKLGEISALAKKFEENGRYKTVYQPALEIEERSINKIINSVTNHTYEQINLINNLTKEIQIPGRRKPEDVFKEFKETILPLFIREKERVLSIGKSCVAFNEEADPLKSQLNKMEKPILDNIEKLIAQISAYKTSDANTPLGRLKDSLASTLKEALHQAKTEFADNKDYKTLHNSIEYAIEFTMAQLRRAKTSKSSSKWIQFSGKYTELGEILIDMQTDFNKMKNLFVEVKRTQDALDNLNNTTISPHLNKSQPTTPRSRRPS
jgi:hypothetical protein